MDMVVILLTATAVVTKAATAATHTMEVMVEVTLMITTDQHSIYSPHFSHKTPTISPRQTHQSQSSLPVFGQTVNKI